MHLWLFSIAQISKTSLLRLVGLLFFPWVLLLILGFWSIPFFEDFAKELIGFTLFSGILLCLTLLFARQRWRQQLGFYACLILMFFLYFKITFYWAYGSKVSASALFVIFETNGSEASDFLSNYLDIKALLLLAVSLIYLLICSRIFKKQSWTLAAKSTSLPSFASRLLLFGGLGLVLAYGIHWKFPEENIPYMVVSTFKEYNITKERLKDQLASSKGYDYGVNLLEDQALTVVVVIGESTSRKHMQLNEYPRETNPKLNKIKDQLLVFDSVISPHVHTITALDKIMTLQDFQNPKVSKNVSLVQLANQAGFTTYWLSNQRAVGVFESIPTIIGSAADYKYFLNGNNFSDRAHDDVILPVFNKVLKEESNQKMIFIHLMGTHLGYEKRYPSEYAYFTTSEQNPDADKAFYINHYDNAIRYNDHILRTLIDSLAASSGQKRLLYFSDHGDDVFDQMEGVGHNEYNPTKPMFEVPLIVWDPSRRNDSLWTATSRLKARYSLEDFVHTFADFSNFDFKGKDSRRSILSPNFKPRKRIIKDSLDYDAQ